ncbi:hypothetical protein EPUS_08255 [Endocarpon pusillum Z07020]|uniref:Uncharacterized protein n=1 Tax=Endocarpon pusillum (strain Z07020 / HMAS-L-300199) TaxID=1263415 RepID=U1GVC0_ENDPU|nr:uncharacterized protein EPUS_08255 [Endocarpon pusillum Z07020]ERF76001.1 hypothetical protein EPUS_08255 [Endocarpon pusillum Z07020]
MACWSGGAVVDNASLLNFIDSQDQNAITISVGSGTASNVDFLLFEHWLSFDPTFPERVETCRNQYLQLSWGQDTRFADRLAVACLRARLGRRLPPEGPPLLQNDARPTASALLRTTVKAIAAAKSRAVRQAAETKARVEAQEAETRLAAAARAQRTASRGQDQSQASSQSGASGGAVRRHGVQQSGSGGRRGGGQESRGSGGAGHEDAGRNHLRYLHCIFNRMVRSITTQKRHWVSAVPYHDDPGLIKDFVQIGCTDMHGSHKPLQNSLSPTSRWVKGAGEWIWEFCCGKEKLQLW